MYLNTCPKKYQEYILESELQILICSDVKSLILIINYKTIFFMHPGYYFRKVNNWEKYQKRASGRDSGFEKVLQLIPMHPKKSSLFHQLTCQNVHDSPICHTGEPWIRLMAPGVYYISNLTSTQPGSAKITNLIWCSKLDQKPVDCMKWARNRIFWTFIIMVCVLIMGSLVIN